MQQKENNELFTFEETPITRLEAFKARGVQFTTITQAASVLGFTDYETRYVISLYRLDAVLVAGGYRVPLPALRSFLLADEKKAYDVFYKAIHNAEIKGVYSLVADGSLEEVRSSLKERGLSPSVIYDLMKKDTFYEYSRLSGEEPAPLDWYDLNELDWPSYGATVADYAEILQVPEKLLAVELKRAPSEFVEWPDFYDYLIEHEVINLPCPFNVEKLVIKEQESAQLSLFN